MQKQITAIILVLIFFCLFAGFDYVRKSDKIVLKVRNAAEIDVDLNNNRVYDEGETVCVDGVEIFTSDLNKNQNDLADKAGISAVDAVKIGYLTDAFADNILSDKRVKVKLTEKQNQNCKFADITINKMPYKNLLKNSGFALNSDGFEQQLKKAQKLNLVILNHKSMKYHNLDCEYGLIAHDSVIVPLNQIPKEAKPCKFCHVTQTNQPAEPQPLSFAYSSGSIKMYLTDLTTKLKPDKKCSSPVCREIVNRINSSNENIDIALYGWDVIPDIQNALAKAKSRGVKIRTVYETSKYYDGLNEILKLSDEKLTDNNNNLMHNKFIIFDGKQVITGSMNFSQTGLSGFNSNCVFFINSVEIASQYLEEFNQMLNGKFHNTKSKVDHKTVILGNTFVTPFFSPVDKTVVTNIIPLIDNAKHYIYIPSFIFTHDALADALVRAKRRGVDVRLIVDAVNTTTARSKVKFLRNAGVPVKVENYAGKLHSKSIIIDDDYIISGSMNYSMSGENMNDENCLIIKDDVLAKSYRNFFDYLWNKIPDKFLKQMVRAEGKSSIGSCTDGVDNNFDGKTDMEDEGCKS